MAIEQAKGRQASPVAEDHLKISLDQLALAAAIDAEAVKQDALARARAAYDQTQSHADYQRLTEAQNALTQATLGVAKAEDQLTVDNAKLTTDQRAKWTDLINELIQKAGMPGLSLSGFNPAQFLIAAFEQSLAFADVMGTVNQIVRVFAQILSALRPVINALLDVVRTVVNVFIFLYDTLARILNMFGMQLQILNYLNGAYAGMVPLIEMWHEIPTLNELAAGKLNSPLSTIPQQLNNLGQQQGQGTMRIVGILVGILGAIIVAKMFAGLSFQQAIQQTAHLLGINVGQKFQTGLQTTTNGLIEQTNTILGELLSAFQSSQIGGGGGAGGVFGAILGLFTGGAGGGVVAAASTMGAAFQAAGTAAQSMGAAFQMASRSINAASESMARAAARTSTVVQQIDRSMSLSYAPQISASVASGYDVERLGTDVAETMLRKLQTGMYSLNRAPVL
ncbi:MAG TPA: hypothetical protein VJP76_05740 [Candidatus Tumulicola sp.]|nr:hypothetical protein [Candidatus Tumulicola sp.]